MGLHLLLGGTGGGCREKSPALAHKRGACAPPPCRHHQPVGCSGAGIGTGLCCQMKWGSPGPWAGPSLHPSVMGLLTLLQCAPVLPHAPSQNSCAGVMLLCSWPASYPLSLLPLGSGGQYAPVLGAHRPLPLPIAPALWYHLTRPGSTLVAHPWFPSTAELSHVGRAGNAPGFRSPKAAFCNIFSP